MDVGGSQWPCEIRILMTTHDRARTAQSFKPLLNTVAIPCAAIKAQHHKWVVNLMEKRFSERFSSNKSFEEVLRHLSCEQMQARRVLSCHQLATMEAKVDPIRSGGGRHCKVHSHHQLGLFHNDVFLEHVVLVKDTEHDVQELGDVFW